jgi:hypothetical protein
MARPAGSCAERGRALQGTQRHLKERQNGTTCPECALKMLWVMGASLALELAPPALWTAALPLSLLAGLVMLGGAPFHFWPADLFQGARPWFAPLAVAALQSLGAGARLWLLAAHGGRLGRAMVADRTWARVGRRVQRGDAPAPRSLWRAHRVRGAERGRTVAGPCGAVDLGGGILVWSVAGWLRKSGRRREGRREAPHTCALQGMVRREGIEPST